MTRQASVVCRTKCKFAVMKKEDYQSVLNNIDRRKIDKLKDFFRQILLFRDLPRQILNTLHLSITSHTFFRG